MTTDIIDRLVGVEPEDRIDVVRRARPEARRNAQNSYDALFGPSVSVTEITTAERFAIAAWTTALTGAAASASWYRTALAQLDEPLAERLAALIPGATTTGPYGAFPAGPLSASDQPGLEWEPSSEEHAALGEHLAAGLMHAHLLVFHPRDASRGSLQRLLDAGWSTTGIVTLSQLVAFVQFQTRVVAGLTVLKEAQQ